MDKICEILRIENKMCENCDKTHEIMKVRRQNVPLNLFFHLVPPHEKKNCVSSSTFSSPFPPFLP